MIRWLASLGLEMSRRLKTRISRYMSYLLRHNPEELKIDERGYVSLSDLLEKLRKRFPQVDEKLVREIVEKSERKRFEIRNGRIRAVYGHSIPVNLDLKEDKEIKILYHGTTPEAAEKILKTGLKPMKRRWAHLSPTIDIAIKVGMRRTRKPVILEIDAEKARENGIKFYKATDQVYLTKYVPPKYIKRINERKTRENPSTP